MTNFQIRTFFGSVVLFLALTGCNSGPTWGPDNPALWAGSGGPLAITGVADNPATMQPISGVSGVTGMLFFQVVPSQYEVIDGPEVLNYWNLDSNSCHCTKLFYISGGKLNVAYNNISLPLVWSSGNNDLEEDAPRAGVPAKTRAIALEGNANALYLASDHTGGTAIFVSGDDGKLHIIRGISEKDSARTVDTAIHRVANVDLSARWLPRQIGVPYLSQSIERKGTGLYAVLGASEDGSSLHALLYVGIEGFYRALDGDRTLYLDGGDVGLDATAIAANDDYTVVANPKLNKVFIIPFNGSQASSINLAGAYAITVLDGTAWVTQSPGGATSTVTPVTLPNTGMSSFLPYDDDYSITADTTGQIKDLPEAAILVSAQPSTWVAIPGAKWVAPAADQSLATRSGKYINTSTLYELEFNLTDPTHTSLDLTIAADDSVDVLLNGKSVFTHSNTNMSTAATTFTINAGFLAHNVLQFNVINATGGPTGLDVAIANTPPAKNGNLVPINLTTGEVGVPIQVGKCPTVLEPYRPDTYTDINRTLTGPQTPLLYVGNSCDATISVVNPVSQIVVQTIKLTQAATAIAVEP